MRIIPREALVKKVRKALPWVIIYGRRKTGKSFLIKKWIKPDSYFFVERNRFVRELSTNEIYSPKEFLRIFHSLLGNERIAVDEFHRLPQDFLDYLHSQGRKGELILITSTLHIAREIMGSGSPLLGLFNFLRVDLINPLQVLTTLSKEVKGKELIEASIYCREPVFGEVYRPELREYLSNYLAMNKEFMSHLIWEIFREEEVELKETFLTVLRGISDGKSPAEIKNLLLKANLISPTTSISKYFDVLIKIGVLEKVRIIGKRNKYQYRHVSPLLDLHFYLDSKYGYTEEEVDESFIREVVEQKLPFHVEIFFEKLLTSLFGLKPVKISKPELEVDVCLVKFKKPEIVAEVKWKNSLSGSELKKVEEKLSRFKEARKFLIVPGEDALPRDTELEVLSPERVAGMIKKS